MTTQAQKAHAFRALHQRDGAFIIPNPWDAGTAKLLTAPGFEALASTSLGLANTPGRPDGAGAVSRGEVLDNCAAIAAAAHLHGRRDLDDTIRTVVSSVAKPLNVVMSTADPAAGVRRERRSRDEGARRLHQ
jgi:hypothetical protein